MTLMAQHRTGRARLGAANPDSIIRRFALMFGRAKARCSGSLRLRVRHSSRPPGHRGAPFVAL